jgi:hypothetical protein
LETSCQYERRGRLWRRQAGRGDVGTSRPDDAVGVPIHGLLHCDRLEVQQRLLARPQGPAKAGHYDWFLSAGRYVQLSQDASSSEDASPATSSRLSSSDVTSSCWAPSPSIWLFASCSSRWRLHRPLLQGPRPSLRRTHRPTLRRLEGPMSLRISSPISGVTSRRSGTGAGR